MGITTGERYIGFQVFISRLSPPVLQPRMARFYAKLVNGYHHWRKVYGFSSFYSSTSGRRASPAYPVLYASLQCKLGSNSGRIAYFASKTGSGQQGALHIER